MPTHPNRRGAAQNSRSALRRQTNSAPKRSTRPRATTTSGVPGSQPPPPPNQRRASSHRANGAQGNPRPERPRPRPERPRPQPASAQSKANAKGLSRILSGAKGAIIKPNSPAGNFYRAAGTAGLAANSARELVGAAQDFKTLKGDPLGQTAAVVEGGTRALAVPLASYLGGRVGGIPGAVAGGVAADQSIGVLRDGVNRAFGTDIELASEKADRIRQEQEDQRLAVQRNGEGKVTGPLIANDPLNRNPAAEAIVPGEGSPTRGASRLRDVLVPAGGAANTPKLAAGEDPGSVRYVGSQERRDEVASGAGLRQTAPRQRSSSVANRSALRAKEREIRDINRKFDRQIANISTQFGGGLAARAKLEELREAALNNRRVDDTSRANNELTNATSAANNRATVAASLANSRRAAATARDKATTAQNKAAVEALAENNQRFDEHLDRLFTGEDGEVDPRRRNAFMKFLDSSDLQADGVRIMDLPPAEQRVALQKAFVEYGLAEEFNDSQDSLLSLGGKQSPVALGGLTRRESELGDVFKGLSAIDYVRSNLPLTNKNVYEDELGRAALAAKLEGGDPRRRKSLRDRIQEGATNGR